MFLFHINVSLPLSFSLNSISISSGEDFKKLKKKKKEPWLVWLSGLSVGLQTKGSPVQFPVRAQAWAAGQVSSRGCLRGNHTPMFFFPLFFSPFPSLKINK